MTAITGHTYPVKDRIKALGGKWDAGAKAWMVPDDKAAEARKIVEGSSATPATVTSGRPRYHSCHSCGGPSRGYYYCWQCKQDRDDSPTAHTFRRADGTAGVWMEY